MGRSCDGAERRPGPKRTQSRRGRRRSCLWRCGGCVSVRFAWTCGRRRRVKAGACVRGAGRVARGAWRGARAPLAQSEGARVGDAERERERQQHVHEPVDHHP
eukprot:1597580-Pleurochrysis_carterae.AAC.1